MDVRKVADNCYAMDLRAAWGRKIRALFVHHPAFKAAQFAMPILLFPPF
jgi:hypothetical protein